MNDHQLLKHLYNIAYLYNQDGDSWRANAFKKACARLEAYPKKLTFSSEGRLQDKISGIGKGIKTTIEEYYRTGTSTKFNELSQKDLPPPSVQELQRIPQVGLATAKKLWKTFGITNLADFEANLDKIKRTEYSKYIDGFKQIKNSSDRIPTSKVKPMVDRIVEPLKKAGFDIGYAGSLRRGRETVRDVDLIVCVDGSIIDTDLLGVEEGSSQREILRQYLEQVWNLSPNVRDGETKWGVSIPVGSTTVTMDLNFCIPRQRGAYYNYLTGSKEFNIQCRSRCKEKGLLLNQEGIFDSQGNQVDDGTEEDLFRILNIPYVPPQCREQNAFGKDFSDLIQTEDIVVDLHSHSQDSDGGATWEQMYEAAAKQGLQVLGISDHSQGSGAGPKEDKKIGLVTSFREKQDSFKIRALYGAEVDIKTSKSLDYSKELLEQLDYFLIAAHHSSDKQLTDRYIEAMNLLPNVPKIIAHPTNRKIGSKDPGEADWNKIFETCKKTNTVLEINGQPERQDLPPEFARAALEAGVYVAINSDCHGTNFKRLLDVAVRSAQRGWVNKNKVINADTNLLNKWLEGRLYSC